MFGWAVCGAAGHGMAAAAAARSHSTEKPLFRLKWTELRLSTQRQQDQGCAHNSDFALAAKDTLYSYLDRLHQLADSQFTGHIGRDAHAAHFTRRVVAAPRVEVNHDHATRALSCNQPAHRTPDAGRAPGGDYHRDDQRRTHFGAFGLAFPG